MADPSLALSEELTNGWFAGSRENPLQELLPDFFNQLRVGLNLDRIVFMGGSGGGFAALFYSWHVADSIAVASLPQTNIWNYYESLRSRYLTTCWPGLQESSGDGPTLDLRDLYRTPSSNSIVYIQSTLDDHHLHGHMAPFLASLPNAMRGRVAVKTSYWGKTGHSGVVPELEWDTWVRAALTSPTIQAEDVVTAYRQSGIEEAPIAGQQAAAAAAKADRGERGVKDWPAAQELVWTRLVAESLGATGHV